ncbi:MAG: hypothetical protein E7Z92_06825 [Cyanobacteria bacterium SIG31]|nr:hypothetical protein [Cyanobacteria bacterium SIG31]
MNIKRIDYSLSFQKIATVQITNRAEEKLVGTLNKPVANLINKTPLELSKATEILLEDLNSTFIPVIPNEFLSKQSIEEYKSTLENLIESKDINLLK